MFFLAQGQKLDEIVLNTKLSRPRVIKIHKKILSLVSLYNASVKKRIGGRGMVVEIDECHLHSRKYGVGRVEAGESWWVLGGICRQTSEMFIEIVFDRSQKKLSKIIFENVQSGTILDTDCWRGYNKLQSMNLNYTHNTVNHSQNFVSPEDPDVYTNTIERAWRSLRESIPMGAHLDEVESYIQMFLFFHHTRSRTSVERFNAMITVCRLFGAVILLLLFGFLIVLPCCMNRLVSRRQWIGL